MTRMLYTACIMKPDTNKFLWSLLIGMVTYILVLFYLHRSLHPTNVERTLTLFSLPLFPAISVAGIINARSMKPPKRRYFWRMVIGMSAYVMGIDLMNHFYTPQSPYRYVLILLPVVPLVYVCFAIVRAVLDMDEMKRKIATEAMAFTGLATGFTCFSYIFIRQSGGPQIPLDCAFYIMWIYYLIGMAVSWWRYR